MKRTMRERRGTWLRGAAVVVAMAAALPAGALPLFMGNQFTADYDESGFLGSWTNPETDTPLSASVLFRVDRTNSWLNVWLDNMSSEPVAANSDLLHGVFFNAGNNPSLTPLSATATHGLVDRDGGTNRDDNRLIPDSADVGGNYAYQADLDLSWVADARGANQGIAGVGYDLGGDDFAGATQFPGEEGSFPAFPLQYGIVPELGEDNYWGDARQTVPLVQQPVVYRQMRFIFDIMDETDFDARNIHDVGFAYGTDLDVVPEPATLTLLGVGLAGLGVRRRRRR